MLQGPRAATVSEIPAVVGLSNAVFTPDGSGDMGAAFPLLFHADNANNLRIFLDDAKPVSLVAQTIRDIELGGARMRAALIGSVCTLETYRGQRLAGQLMDDAITAARAQGATVILVSGWRGLYRRMGCIDAGLYRMVTVSAKSRFPKLPLEVRPWTHGDVAAMEALQRKERVRYHRAEHETRIILESGRLFARPGRTWVVYHQGRLAAWLAASDPVRPDDGDGLTVRELAGSRLAALTALPAVLRSRKLPRAVVETLDSDPEIEALVSAFGLAAAPHGFHGTVKIIDPRGLLESLEPWTAERLGAGPRARLRVEAGERTAFELDGNTHALGLEDLAALIFGSVERTPPPPPAGPLADVLGRLFPVPIPSYGLSYT